MDDEIAKIYDEIVSDPNLLDEIIREYVKQHTNISAEKIHSLLLQHIALELSEEADEEKKLRQKSITRDRIISKTLDHISNSGEVRVSKAEIKNAVFAVSNSSTGHEKEHLADLLNDYSTSHSINIKKRDEARDEINRGLQNA